MIYVNIYLFFYVIKFIFYKNKKLFPNGFWISCRSKKVAISVEKPNNSKSENTLNIYDGFLFVDFTYRFILF
jgi:hypothetical protein